MNQQNKVKDMLFLKEDNINIFENERKLILLAVIKANFNLKKAYEINAPKWLSYEGYIKKFYRYGVGLKELKTAVKN